MGWSMCISLGTDIGLKALFSPNSYMFELCFVYKNKSICSPKYLFIGYYQLTRGLGILRIFNGLVNF